MKLIVNADDYGLTLGVSKGIIEAMKLGVVTDTSALVSSPYFAESAKLALENGITEMGIHCLLTMGKPITDPKRVPTLVNEKGYFYLPQQLMQKEIAIEEVEMELEAQIQALLNSGLKLNHIDTHHGFMNHSTQTRDLFIKLARKYNVPLRNESVLFNNEEATITFQASQVKLTDSLYFNSDVPHHVTKNIISYLKSELDKEVVEIGCHVGYSDDILRKLSPLNDYREKDLEVFLSKELIEYIKDNYIELINYSKL